MTDRVDRIVSAYWTQAGSDGPTAALQSLATALHKAEHERDALAVEIAGLRQRIDESRLLKECQVCRWPVPYDNEGYICPCCGAEGRYDDPARYHWDGKWWAKPDDERAPEIVRRQSGEIATRRAAVADLAVRLRAIVNRERVWGPAIIEAAEIAERLVAPSRDPVSPPAEKDEPR